MKNIRIVFMGTPLIACDYFKLLIENNYNVIAIFTQPPRKKGRGMNLQQSPVHDESLKHNIPVFHPINFCDQKNIDLFIRLKADLVIVMAYGLLLPKEILEAPQYGCINIHFSLLPRWRGATPIEHALLNGDKETGVTIFRLVNKLDSGPIISSESLKIKDDMDKNDLTLKLNQIGKKLLIDTLPNYLSNRITLIDQNKNEKTYAHKIYSKDRKLDFYSSVNNICNKVKAFSPAPSAWCVIGNENIKIIKCKKKHIESLPSTIVNDKFHLGCKDGSIEPLIVQREGKKPMKIDEFLKGFHFDIGQTINA